MSHAFRQKVFYADTDSYGVVWHGSYIRWLEMGRVLFCESKGYKMSQLEENDIVLPVLNINIDYKKPAKMDDEIVIKTSIAEIGKYYVTFQQEILDEEEKDMYIKAKVKVAAIHKDGKLYRSLPEFIYNM